MAASSVELKDRCLKVLGEAARMVLAKEGLSVSKESIDSLLAHVDDLFDSVPDDFASDIVRLGDGGLRELFVLIFRESILEAFVKAHDRHQAAKDWSTN